MLLRSDQRTVAVGWNGNGQRFLPELETGMSFWRVFADDGYVVLLRSDGQAVCVGEW